MSATNGRPDVPAWAHELITAVRQAAAASGDDSDWSKWSKWVVAEINRAVATIGEHDERIRHLEVSAGVLKVKTGTFVTIVAIASAISTGLSTVATYLLTR